MSISEQKMPKSYAIIGTGAIGGFYGAKLQQAGSDVHFLVHSDYDYMCQHGLQVQSPQGDILLQPVQVYSHAGKMPKCDVVVVALKSVHNHILKSILPHLLHDNSTILLLQNGLGSEENIADVIKNHPIVGGLCFICSNKIGPGLIQHLDYSEITLGQYSPEDKPVGITSIMREIGADFNRAKVPVQLSEDLVLARWKKLVWNIPYNGLSVVLNARTDEMMGNADIRILAEELMREVLAGAGTFGREIPESFIVKMLTHTEKMKPYKTSMKLDYDLKRPLEIEAIFGTPLRKVAAKGINLPKIAMLYRQLKFLDKQNRSQKAD